jgi:hypothetical protein
MSHARLVVAALGSSLLAGTAVAQEPLEPPRLPSACQTGYGAAGTVELSWTNAESYDAIELTLDGQPAPGDVDGTFTAGRVEAAPGQHVFGVRGRLGDRASPLATVSFTVLAESPLLNPIADLDCEIFQENGGFLRLTWKLGADAWTEGTVSVPGTENIVAVAAGATRAEISLVGATDRPSNEPRVAELVFKNAQGYTSPVLTPLCVARTPAFLRGDCDGTGKINITDPIVTLTHLFQGKARWLCDDACDANDDGKVNISDPITLLSHLFQGGGPLPPPGPKACGIDFTPDFLGGTCTCE